MMFPKSSAIAHVDLDAFFASVEQRDDPLLRGRPVIVGGLGNRGVVAAASYEARKFGVFSATPMSRARRACPDGVFLAPRFEAYTEASRAVMTIFESFTPLVEPLSLDEAFLDVTGTRGRHRRAEDLAQAIRDSVKLNTQLVVSVGVGTTKLVAKIASALAKPDGLRVVEPGTELAFLRPQPVSRLWGVGPVTLQKLHRLGVTTIAELAALPGETLERAVGVSLGRHLQQLANNVDDRHVTPDRQRKSIGAEETFATDLVDRASLDRELVRLVDRVAGRLRKADVMSLTIQIKVRYADFRTITRARSFEAATSSSAELLRAARTLFDAVDITPGVRLLGVAAQRVVAPRSSTVQLSLDQLAPAAATDRAALERAVDAVRERFGEGAVGSATLLKAGGLHVSRHGGMWGPERDERNATG